MQWKKEIKYCPFCGSRYGIQKIQEKNRLFCERCRQIYYENPVPAATALVVNDNNQILLGKRKVEPAKGEWCLPGGFIEQGESMQQAALRELKEETGLEGTIISFIDCIYQESKYYGSLIIFGYAVRVVGGTIRANDDMEMLCFFNLHELPSLAFTSHQQFIEKLKKEFLQ